MRNLEVILSLDPCGESCDSESFTGSHLANLPPGDHTFEVTAFIVIGEGPRIFDQTQNLLLGQLKNLL